MGHLSDARNGRVSAIVVEERQTTSLKIGKREARRVARALAEVRGESRAAAVTEALREPLEGMRREHSGSLADRLLV